MGEAEVALSRVVVVERPPEYARAESRRFVRRGVCRASVHEDDIVRDRADRRQRSFNELLLVLRDHQHTDRRLRTVRPA
jgi:hypothetical protein